MIHTNMWPSCHAPLIYITMIYVFFFVYVCVFVCNVFQNFKMDYIVNYCIDLYVIKGHKTNKCIFGNCRNVCMWRNDTKWDENVTKCYACIFENHRNVCTWRNETKWDENVTKCYAFKKKRKSFSWDWIFDSQNDDFLFFVLERWYGHDGSKNRKINHGINFSLMTGFPLKPPPQNVITPLGGPKTHFETTHLHIFKNYKCKMHEVP